MITRKVLILSLVALAVFSAAAQETAVAPSAARLPVKRVVLYKNGVGYFEHQGAVKDNQSVDIAFTTGQLDDVLKSLTVLDQGGGRITGVTYGSSDPRDRQLAGLPLNTDTLYEFLSSLRGARVELKSGALTWTGRLLTVERKTRTGGGATVEVDYLSMITDAGEMRTTELSAGFSVRLLDSALNGTVKRYLDIVNSAREPDQRRMTIATAGDGLRPLLVSYISEVPVWKATYRIVLPTKADQKPLLQGWAIVDNTGAQDWENVELSLVAGAPQSFIQKLSVPYYTHRPVAAIKESLSAAPQTFDAPVAILGGGSLNGTVRDPAGAVIAGARAKVFDANGTLAAEATSDANGRFTFGSVPDGSIRLEVTSPGFNTFNQSLVSAAGRPLTANVELQLGAMTDTVEVTADGSARSRASLGSGRALGGGAIRFKRAAPPPPPPPPAQYNSASLLSAAKAEDLGDLFEYKLKEPISIRKSQSALVPILHSPVSAEKVSIWTSGSQLPKPLRALWLENTSTATLDAGAFSVLESGVFAGEGLIESLRPGEKRLISYAVDLALTPDTKAEPVSERRTRVRVAKGSLVIVKEQRESLTYSFRNADSTPRTVVVEHPARPGFQLRSTPTPQETAAGLMRFRLEVPPRQTARLVVEEARPVEATYRIADLDSDLVALFVRQKSIDPALEEALKKVLAQKAVVRSFDAQESARESEAEVIYNDQERLRENMKALKGTPEERALVLRYTKQLNDQETRLEQLKREIEDVNAKQESAQKDLDRLIESLVFDIEL
ncbi:MAG: carboxypeptidase regulatory-like domain-containing protein [Bryobacteraceae bacterium]|nr:carboxypeptidase regulatory-like domain-containing protein [Bryobacteraceae bacterium]